MNKNVLICIPSFDQKIHLETISSIICVIDADIVFEPQDLIRVLLFDKPLTSAPYPLKHEEKIEKGDASKGWCLNFPLGKYDLTDNNKGFKKVNYVGTGFMCIERIVFETIIKKYPSIEYLSDIKANIDGKREIDGKKEYAENTKRYLSEDYYFCALWKQCNGEIWSDLTSQLKHIGIKEYTRLPIAKIKEKK